MTLHPSRNVEQYLKFDSAPEFGRHVTRISSTELAGIPSLSLRLYLAKGAAGSKRALSDLKLVCEERFGHSWDLEVIDVTDSPDRALSDGVLITPTLLKLSPPPFSMISGDSKQMCQFLALVDAHGMA